MVIEAVGVNKSYSRGSARVQAVREVSLSVHAGEMLAVVGPSGSGKSTLLNLLGALDRPDSGEVTINGAKLSSLDDAGRTQLRRTDVGLIFQFFNLMPLLTALENAALPMLLAQRPRKEAEARAAALLERVGLGGRLDHVPEEMSGGEMQRVAIARALGPQPPVVLADEPTGNLDSRTGESVLALLRSLCSDEGCAMVMVTHSGQAAATADRVLEYRDGTIVAERPGADYRA